MTDITDEQIRRWAVEATLQIDGADQVAAERGLMAVPEMLSVFRRFAELARSDLWGDGNAYMRTDDAFNLMELARQEERERAIAFLMKLHEQDQGAHNYFKWAANKLREAK